ncbi:hypothetical protein BCR41DRAFT_358686 [Lobosporangium transversale]|uniref:F-box domain-containing protein n=1 Tax=Lobosporangium transversale TaxID=64571 RepID=A0A1Y2GHS4_9FUNG|nr:hypothetical protein BCR41DRAFT_358686 [Lobosporangium transversale]ORZ09426.1 hypothetical protein BCR41DRAFT_358686 [Lobosporangium transversale]|eukprot:XP_021878879.1 hypothetical protein BCR41DRAFT_358686 [Lobosporangium transversale]
MMSNSNLNPMDIPEIISRVGDFLEQGDLLRCILVSRTFHNTLAGSKSICKRIEIGDAYSRYRKYPTGAALQSYKENIEELLFYYKFPKEYMSLQGCVRLQSIKCQSQSLFNLSELSSLIMSHSSTITKFELSTQDNPTLREIWTALLGCTHLEVLTISSTQMCNDGVDLFFQVCKRVRCLEMSYVDINRLPPNFLNDGTDEFIFPNMTTLHLRDVRISTPPTFYSSSYCLGILAKRCPKLRSLKFDEYARGGILYRTGACAFYKAVFVDHPFTLTSLSDLYMGSFGIKDEDMAALLRKMTELRRLDIPDCEFGPLSMQELLADEQEVLDGGHIVRKRRDRRLCDTVEILIFQRQGETPAGVGQAILSNCPRLKELAGPKVKVTEIVDGEEWVSTDLTYLVIRLEADVDKETAEGMQKQRIVFKQLAKMTKLRVLYLTNYNSVAQYRTLDLRLRAGLDELANLKRLHLLSFNRDMCQQMQSEDVTWIINNWPKIKRLDGVVNYKSNAMASLFVAHNISAGFNYDL